MPSPSRKAHLKPIYGNYILPYLSKVHLNRWSPGPFPAPTTRSSKNWLNQLPASVSDHSPVQEFGLLAARLSHIL